MEVGHVGSLLGAVFCAMKNPLGQQKRGPNTWAAAWQLSDSQRTRSYKLCRDGDAAAWFWSRKKSSEIYCMWISIVFGRVISLLGVSEKSKTCITKSCNRCTIVALWARDAIMLALLWGWIHVWSRVYFLNRVGVVELPWWLGHWWFFGTTIIWCQWNVNGYCWWIRNPAKTHQGCLKRPVIWWDKTTNWPQLVKATFLNHQQVSWDASSGMDLHEPTAEQPDTPDTFGASFC